MKRMALLSLLFFIFLSSADIRSQNLRLTNGISMSTMKFPLEQNSYNLYQGGIQMDYMKKKFLFLSSGVEYLQHGGGMISRTLGTEEENRIDVAFRYLSANTMLNVYKELDGFILYLGAGVRIDYMISDKIIDPAGVMPYPDEFTASKAVYGLKCALGADYYIPGTDYFIGLSAGYYPNFSSLFKNRNDRTANYSLMVSIGYILMIRI